MITLDSPKLQEDIRKWNAGISARLELFGGRKATVLLRQAGLLCRTLIEISPPRNRAKTAANITNRVNAKFHQMSESSHASPLEGKKAGQGDVRWYAFSKWAIYGVAKDVDFTSASPEQLYSLYFGRKLNKSGRFMAGTRGRQKVYIWQKITTDPRTVAELIKRLLEHIGRLKAAWAVSWKNCGSPGKPVSKWITRHLTKGTPRGYSINGLGIPSEPSFTIVNTAKGVSAAEVQEKAQLALRIRLKAMSNDMLFALKNPDQWSAREARADAAQETL